MRDLADGGGVFDVAEVVWLLDIDACGVGVNGSFDPFDIGQAVCRWWIVESTYGLIAPLTTAFFCFLP